MWFLQRYKMIQYFPETILKHFCLSMSFCAFLKSDRNAILPPCIAHLTEKGCHRMTSFVPRAGIEPARPFRAKGFSCHYGFRHRGASLRFVCGPDYSFTMEIISLGVSCLVSAPSSLRRLGSRLPSALPVKDSLNLRHSTSLLSKRALNLALPR